MKRFLSLLLVLVMALGLLAACGGSDQKKTPGIAQQAMESGNIHYYFMTGNGASVGYEKYTTRWGDSCLIAFPDGKVMLIDTGIQEFYPILKETLTKLGVSTIDYMVFSHPHNDHAGGAWMGLFDDFTISQVYHNGARNVEWGDDKHIEVICEKYNVPCTAWTAGDTAEFGKADNPVKLQVLWPTEEVRTKLQNEEEDAAVNALSLVLRFDYGEHSSLFTGDIYQNRHAKNFEVQVENHEGTEELLLAGWQKDLLDVDLLKIPHHGNPLTSCSMKFVKAVSPEYAVATSFEPVNPYFTYYKKVGLTCPVYFDRQYGQITVTAGADGTMKVTTERTDYLEGFGPDWSESEKIVK